MKNNKDITIYLFDKGSGFVVLSEKMLRKKLRNSQVKRKDQKMNQHGSSPTKFRKYYAD